MQDTIIFSDETTKQLLTNLSIQLNWTLVTKTIKCHVDSHLLFGIISRKISPVVVITVLLLLNILFLGDILLMLLALLIGFFFKDGPKYHFAAMCWIATKVSLALGAFMLLTFGTFYSYSEGQSDWIYLFLLGLLWLPSVEFVTHLTQHQKWMTATRIIASIPVVYLGFQTGYWSW